MMIDAVSSLHVSTQEGSFVFAPTFDCDNAPFCTSICSTDLNSIENLQVTDGLRQSNRANGKNE